MLTANLYRFLKLCYTLTFRQLKCQAVVLWHVGRSVLLCVRWLSTVTSLCMSLTHSSGCVCGNTRCLIAFFIFLIPVLFVFWSLSLFLCTWLTLKASVCIPEQLRDTASNKEDYCLSLKKGQPSLEVFPWVIHNTFRLLVQWRHPFIPHPRGEWKSSTEGCRVSRAKEKRDKINSSLEWNYCRLWATISHLVVPKHS